MNLTNELISKCQLSPRLQTSLVKSLTDRLTVHTLLLDPIMVSTANDRISSGVAKALRINHYPFTIENIVSLDKQQTIIGAMSCKKTTLFNKKAIQDANIDESQIVRATVATEEKFNRYADNDQQSLSPIPPQALANRVVLLLEPVMYSPERFRICVEELIKEEVHSIIPVTAYLVKDAVIGTTVQIRTGIYLHQYEEYSDLCAGIQRDENLLL